VKKYQVDLAYAGHVSEIVEAETEEEAIKKAEQMGTGNIGKLFRWPEADMIEEAAEEPDPGEPEEGDYIISSCGCLGSDTRVSIVGGGSADLRGEEQDADARAYIRDRMQRENFYPTVWMASDHGNLDIVDIWKEE
jgi:hypothetical protein